MADFISQLRQQRQGIEEARRRLMSQQNLRQSQTRNQLLQRQQQLQQLGQQDQALQSQLSQLEEAQKQQQEQQGGGARQSINEFLYMARKLASSKLPLSEISRAEGLRDIVKAYREEGGLGTQQQKLIDLKFKPTYAADAASKPSVYGPQLPEYKATLTEISPQTFIGNSPYGTIQRAGGQFTGRLTAKQVPRQITETNLVTGQKQYYEEIFAKRPESVVYATRPSEFTILGQDIKSSLRKNDLPTAVRDIITRGTAISVKKGQAKLEQGLVKLGVGKDSPLFKQTGIPFSAAGNLALGIAFTPVFATGTSQTLESEYIFDYISGRFIKKSEVSKVAQQRFAEALKESSEFRKLGIEARGANVATEGELRRETARLINEAVAQGKLKQLQNFYIKAGREDLFLDVAAQEGFAGAARATIRKQIEADAIKDFPSNIKGASTITSQFAGTGMYERTADVAVPQPKIQNPSLASNLGTAFNQSSFDRNRLAQINSLGLSTLSTQTSQLGLRSDTVIKQPLRLSSGLASGLSSAQRSAQQSKLTQRQALDFFRNRARRNPRFPKTPFGFKLPDDNIISRKNLGVKDILGFIAEVKTKKGFVSLGEETTLEEALRKGAGVVDKTLLASFRVRRGNEILRVNDIPFGFERSKRNANVLIESKSKRLNTFGETKDIQLFKKTRRSKKNVFGF